MTQRTIEERLASLEKHCQTDHPYKSRLARQKHRELLDLLRSEPDEGALLAVKPVDGRLRNHDQRL